MGGCSLQETLPQDAPPTLQPLATETRPVNEIVGIVHSNGKYNFSSTKDFMNEGADEILSVGSRVIKVWLRANRDLQQEYYPYNSSWPTVNSLAERAQNTYFKALFSKPFKTFVLLTNALSDPSRDPNRMDGSYWWDGMTDAEKASTQKGMYELAKHLLITYRGTGKTFVLQNWEGDNYFRLVSGASGQGMIDYFNARQAGVEQARAEVGTSGVMVVHAVEVNYLTNPRVDNSGGIVNNVVPYTRADLYSYSAYEHRNNVSTFTANLDYLKAKAPASALYGANNVFVGEYGFPENTVGASGQRDLTRSFTEAALNWGVRYLLYWEVYCNERKDGTTIRDPRPANSDMKGFWIVRPDDSKPPVYTYFKNLYNPIIVDNASSNFLSTSPSGPWIVSNGLPDYWRGDYKYDPTRGPDGSDTHATWTPNIPTAGSYRVYMRWVSNEARPDAAPLEIKHANGVDTSKRVNQQQGGGNWALIGTYNLVEGVGNYVRLLATDDGYTTADAVKFERQ